MATTTAPIHILRGILRHLKSPSPMSRTTATRRYVLEQFRQNRTESPLLAQEYLSLQQDLAERQRLYELDAGAEEKLSPKELTRLAAARAGLQPPKLDPDLK
mmetsp:Transcript_19342/g.53811  ORF Transcript_19342/g.53811 Transcript_19342/m.53811 type:complete len:102 (+) Transcript_19342:146-451(+)